jgi:hypothetical protein
MDSHSGGGGDLWQLVADCYQPANNLISPLEAGAIASNFIIAHNYFIGYSPYSTDYIFSTQSTSDGLDIKTVREGDAFI